MDFLPGYDDGQLNPIVRSAIREPAVHGVDIRLDPIWAWAEAARWTLDDHELRDAVHRLAWMDASWSWDPSLRPYLPTGATHTDLKWRPEWWSEVVLQNRPSWSQMIVTIAVRPDMFDDRYGPDGEFRRAFSEFDFPNSQIRIEPRPIPILQAGASLEHAEVICGDMAGSTGGLVDNSLGLTWLAASAHVCRLGKRVTVNGHDGTCVQSEELRTQDAEPNELDFDDAPRSELALIALDNDTALTRSPGLVTGSASRGTIQQGSTLTMINRNRERHFEADALSVAQQFLLPDRSHGRWALFRDLLMLRPSRDRLYGRVTETGTTSNGDSGAWLLRDGPYGPEWAASVIGARYPISYAAFAHRSLATTPGTTVHQTAASTPQVA